MSAYFEIVLSVDKTMLVELAVDSHDIYGPRKADLSSTKIVFDISDQAITDGTIEVLKLQDEIIGFYCIHICGDFETELAHLFVKPGHQRKGYGTQLFKRSLEMAKRKGKSEILTWISDSDSVEFYRKQGAWSVGVADNILNPGVPVSIMNMSLVEDD